MADNGPVLGKPVKNTFDANRDAIHVAVAPAISLEDLQPGQHVGFSDREDELWMSASAKKKIGIVDPFLVGTVTKGTHFWLVLYPNSVKNLRHQWNHPAYDAIEERREEAQYDSGCRGC